MSTEAALKAYLDALVAGDLDVIAASFAEDATWTIHGTLPIAGVHRGRKAIVNFLVDGGALYRPGTQAFTFGPTTVEGERAVLEWQVRGVGAATGSAYDNAYCGIFVIRDGLIVEVREYLDSLHAAEVLFAR